MKTILLPILALALLASPAPAQPGKPGLSSDQKASEPIQSARKSLDAGTIAMQIAAGLIALCLVYAAWSTWKKGFQITKDKRVQGTPAHIIAAILLLAAVALGVLGIVYLPGLLP